MPTRRTTLAADSNDLALLEREARRRGVSLAQVLREIVAREATELRRRRRPRFGIAAGGGGIAELSWRDEEAPARGRLRSP
jgi:Ribbon-helix-helix protein, copG family